MRYPVLKGHLLVVIFVFLSSFAFSQQIEYIVPLNLNQQSWSNFVKEVEATTNYRFFYHSDSIVDFQINIASDGLSLEAVLSENLSTQQYYFSIDAEHNVFVSKNQALKAELPPGFIDMTQSYVADSSLTDQTESSKDFLSTTKTYVAKTLVVGSAREGVHISKATVSGYIKNREDGLAVVGATLYIPQLETGTTTDALGFYSLQLPKGKYRLVVNSIDTEEGKYELQVLSNGKLDLLLDKKVYALDEVIIKSERYDNVRGTQMGFEKISTKSIKEIPTIMGERDIIKVALLLPGVQSVGEGASGFNVRGSPADQNLFYINNVPIYNTSHLFGFFSTFPPDAISEFTLYKSNFPAKFGGRLSSIFDITAKDGNKKNFSARGGISPITGKLLVEGPIVKDKSSYLVGVRSTYSNWVLKLIENPEIKNSRAGFADAVANFSIALTPKDRIKILGYYSYDDIKMANHTQFNYENIGTSVTWNHVFKEKHNFELSYIYSNYGFGEENSEFQLEAYKHSYRLKHNEVRAGVTLRPNNDHRIAIGVNSVLYMLDQGEHLPLNSESLIDGVDLGQEKGLESSVYISEDWDISPLFSISAGLRYNFYSYLGPQDVYSYVEGAPKEIENITDTTSYGNNEIIKSYSAPDFRLAAKYIINPNLSVKASFNTLHQYIFMLSNTIALSPTDKWKLSDSHIKPMSGQQYAVGAFTNLAKNKLEFSTEVYYKRVKNLVEYKDGADLLVNEVPEVDVLQGELEAYGIEFMLKKPFGRLNGWVNYTYSKSMVVVDSDIPGNQTNFGKAYPANYDKPHALNLVLNYKFSRRLSISGNLVYATGRPTTYPSAIYYQNGMQVLHYSMRNEYRLPDYFRVDLSINLEGNLLAKKLAHGSWNLSVYNVTGRKNAYSVYFTSENGQVKGYKLSVFGVPIVSLSYNFKLGNYAN